MSAPHLTRNPTGVCASCREPLAEYTYFVDIVPTFLPWEARSRHALCERCAALARRDDAGMDAVLTSVEAFFLGEVATQ